MNKSFADRLSFPAKSEEKKLDWAEEASTPVKEKSEEAAKAGSVGTSQIDGAPELGFGSALSEPEFDVNVKLADLQDDPNNPLYSAKTFDQLNL